MKRTFFFIFVQILVFSFCQAQAKLPQAFSKNTKNGVCYCKCTILDGPMLDAEELEKEERRLLPYFIYTGNDPAAFTEEIMVFDELPTEKWVKHYLTGPCEEEKKGVLSCQYEVLTEEYGHKTTIKVTEDTALYKPFYIEYYYPLSKNQQWLDNPEANREVVAVSEWQETLCGDREDAFIFEYIGLQLKKEGLLKKEYVFTDSSKKELANALTEYQTKYRLPVGTLNIKTLRAMGIRF
ncbi:MAG: hypothetical protein RLZZ292_2021 [Bacteroidota bacterium]|jgi:hypothetical protein